MIGAVVSEPGAERAALDAAGRRLERLRLELDDEGIALPHDPALQAVLLTELDYARRPHAHEGVAPRFGALVSAVSWPQDAVDGAARIDLGDVPLKVARRLADGRAAFLVRTLDGGDRIVCFEHSHEYEATAVTLAAATGAVVLQRLARGWVRLCGADGVATWDGIDWSSKPLAAAVTASVAVQLPAVDKGVLGALLEFCVHWLGAGRIGTTLVWRPDGDPAQLEHLGLLASVTIPELDLTCRSDFSPLLSALSQYDRAALVDGRGRVRTIGVQLRSSDRTRRTVGPHRGTRHTSALRFTHDEPDAVVFVVSSNGSLSVCWNGRLLRHDLPTGR